MATISAVNPYDPAKPFFACDPVDMSFYTNAPQVFVNEVELAVDASRLFAILDDEKSWPIWAAPGIRQVTWTSKRPHGAGTTRTVRMAGGLEVYETFFIWEEGKELAFYFTGATQEVWSRFAERYEVTPTGPGSCRLKWTLAYEPKGGFARVHRFVKPVMGFALKSYLKNLAKYVRTKRASG